MSSSDNTETKLSEKTPFLSVERPGDSIGVYKLMQVIGEGGAGTVYMAEQQEPIRRRVALKVIKLGMDTKEVVARFEAERQALALMDHPNIAKVFDGGATEAGRPYFVMELVHGVPITEFCDQHNVSIAERLELFMSICQAVQHAHQKGIIHRDLKPSNVLVALHDSKAAVRIIDFGIAKATQQPLTEKTLLTQLHQFIGTPAYMSPEQAEMTSLDIDTRSDIYSLGVLLYELLTGRTPFESKELLAAGLDAMRRRIRDEEPKKPSTRVSTFSGEELTTVARRRQLAPRQLSHFLRGELDWIASKALEKDRRCRYESASAFAEDIQRYLDHEPVHAVAPSALYAFQKFARRHRTALGTGVAVAVMLLIAAIVAGGQAVRAERHAREAGEQAAIAQAVNDFLRNDLLGQASPEAEIDPDIKLRTVLDRAAQTIEGRFTNQPLVEAAIRQTIAEVYAALPMIKDGGIIQNGVVLSEVYLHLMDYGPTVRHRLDHAYPHIQKAIEIRQRLLGPENSETFRSRNTLGRLYQSDRKYQEAQNLYQELAAISARRLGSEHVETLRYKSSLADTYGFQHKYSEAHALYQEIFAARKRLLGPTHPETLRSMASLAKTHEWKTPPEPEVGETLLKEVIELAKLALGPTNPLTVECMQSLARLYGRSKRYAEGERVIQETFENYSRLLGSEHPFTLYYMHKLGHTYLNHQKYAEAETVLQQALPSLRRVLGPEHPQTLRTMGSLGGAYSRQGKHPEQGALLEEALAINQRVRGPEHPETLDSMFSLARNYRLQRKYTNAESLHLKVLELRKRVLGTDHPSTLNAMTSLADCYRAQGNQDAAAELMAAARTIYQRQRMEALDRQIAEASKKLQAEPRNAQLLAERAYLYGRRGRFGEAAAENRRVVELNPTNHWGWFYGGCLLAYLGDEKAFQAHCQGMFERFQNFTQREIGERTAKTCLLLPSDRKTTDRFVELIDRALRPDPSAANPWFYIAKGMAEYRTDHFDEALNWFAQAKKQLTDPTALATCDLFGAMAHHRLGHTDDAQAGFRHALNRIEREIPKADVDDLGEGIENWLICQIARREAAVLLIKGQ
jgi:serine/threonine protein kinase